MKLNNNDDSHNSGLNLLIYNMLLDIESHPAWVCGLKHQPDEFIIIVLIESCIYTTRTKLNLSHFTFKISFFGKQDSPALEKQV